MYYISIEDKVYKISENDFNKLNSAINDLEEKISFDEILEEIEENYEPKIILMARYNY